MKKVLVVILIITIIIFIPLALDWFIIGNSYKSNIHNSEWVSFFSGYINSVITMLGIILTIRFTSSQNKKDRENQIKPYCVLEYTKEKKIEKSSRQLGVIQIGYGEIKKPEIDNTDYIYIKNIGLGPAVEFEIKIDKPSEVKDYHSFSVQRGSERENSSINTLIQNEDAVITLSSKMSFIDIPDGTAFEEYEEALQRPIYILPSEYMEKYKEHDLTITISYRDMYQNVFEQKMVLCCRVYPVIDSEGHAQYQGSYVFKDTTNPKRTVKAKRQKNNCL